MKPPKFNAKSLSMMVLGLLMLSTASCRKAKKPERLDIENLKVELAPELMINRIGELDGAFYQNYKDSPIHWQPWEPAAFERAEASKRLLFCVVAVDRYPEFDQVMRSLDSNAAVVEIINSSYVPVLIDGDVAREMEILAVELSNEINRPIASPLFLWMEYNRNPVACTPVSQNTYGAVSQVFNQSHAMIDPMWEDDLELWMVDGSLGYVLNNSAHDQFNRLKRMTARLQDRKYSDDPESDVLVAIRQLLSGYDHYAKNFAEAGGAFPSGPMKLLALVSQRPGVPSGLRKRSVEVVQALLNSILPSPMVDPLDGGVFSTRAAKTWALPTFIRDCSSQADIAEALLMVYQATGDSRVLGKATELIDFIEKSYRLDDGLFAGGANHDDDPQKWMWTIEEVKEVLGDQDAKWWIEASGMKELGNLPLEVDPSRKLFRKNAIAQSMSVAEIASSLSVPVEEFRLRYDDTRKKLLAARDARMRMDAMGDRPHLESTMRMVSAYVQAYHATAKQAYAEKAIQLLADARRAFATGGKLSAYVTEVPEHVGAGRAMHYGIAIKAALDVHEISDGDDCLAWGDVLMEQVMAQFVSESILHECPEPARMIDLPIEDNRMMFGDSSVGVFSMVESRLRALGRSVPKELVQLVESMPEEAKLHPITYCDRLAGVVNRYYPEKSRDKSDN